LELYHHHPSGDQWWGSRKGCDLGLRDFDMIDAFTYMRCAIDGDHAFFLGSNDIPEMNYQL